MPSSSRFAILGTVLILLALAAVVPCLAQWQSIGTVSAVTPIDGGVRISAAPAVVHVTFVSPDIVRIRMSPTGSFGPDRSWAVVPQHGEPVAFKQSDSAGSILLSTSSLKVRIQKSPCRITFESADGTVLNGDEPVKGMSWAGHEVAVWKNMPEDEYYFGFGEKSGMFQRKWHTMTMWNTDIPAYHADTDPLYQTIPFFYAVKNGRTSGIFFDNTYYSHFDMGTQNREEYSFGAVDGEMNYYFINGPLPSDVYRRFTGLTGNMPMPPKWAIGYQQCRWSYTPEKRVREIASGFRSRNIPCDVLYLDIDYMDGYRCFTWGKERFPEPAKMIGDLRKDGFKTVVIIDPGIKQDTAYWVYQSGLAGDNFAKYPDGKVFTGKVWPGVCAFPDFTKPLAREWWGSLFKGLADTGVMGFWNDMNEPSVFDVPGKTFDLNVIHDDEGLKTDHRKNHNIYGMQMTRATREGLLKLKPDERPFVLTRANYAGGQRYTAAWTGDNVSSWEHLQMALTMCLNLSISGQPFVGSDIGGFIGKPSGELYARWLELGVFTPLMRSHSEINSVNKEPWEYGEKFIDINRSTINLRYTFLPYIYTAFRKSAAGGPPMMRPLMFDYPGTETWNDREFMFGDNILVAPVLWEETSTRGLQLPEGNWYDYWTDSVYSGGKYINVDAPLGRLPFFIRAGAIIPTQQMVQYTDQEPADPLTFNVYPGGSAARGDVYEDDGHTFAFEKGVFSQRTVSLKEKKNEVTIIFSKPEGTYRPAPRTLRCVLHSCSTAPKSVSVDGKKIQEGPGGWQYDAGHRVLTVGTADKFTEQRLVISE